MSKKNNLCPTLWERILGQKKMNSHGLHVTSSSQVINTIPTNDYHHNVYVPHSTFLDYIQASFC
jgi:hypothetical protein